MGEEKKGTGYRVYSRGQWTSAENGVVETSSQRESSCFQLGRKPVVLWAHRDSRSMGHSWRFSPTAMKFDTKHDGNAGFRAVSICRRVCLGRRKPAHHLLNTGRRRLCDSRWSSSTRHEDHRPFSPTVSYSDVWDTDSLWSRKPQAPGTFGETRGVRLRGALWCRGRRRVVRGR